MIFPQILTSVILIVSGVLVKKYPNLMAGYNSLSEKEKEGIDTEGLSTFLKNILIILGLGTFVLYFICSALSLGIKNIYIINACIITLGVVVAIVYANIKFKSSS